jgi:hypothetical protein
MMHSLIKIGFGYEPRQQGPLRWIHHASDTAATQALLDKQKKNLERAPRKFGANDSQNPKF